MAKNDRTRDLLLDNGDMLYNQNQQISNIVKTLEQTSETANNTAIKLKEQDDKIINIANTVWCWLRDVPRTKTSRRRTGEWTRTPRCW